MLSKILALKTLKHRYFKRIMILATGHAKRAWHSTLKSLIGQILLPILLNRLISTLWRVFGIY